MDARTRIRSTAMRIFASAGYLQFLRRRARLKRKLGRESAAVHYFHQVDDPYSHLVVQKLEQLQATYRLPFKAHLVSKPAPQFQGSAEHFDQWALRDALSVADAYGTTLHVARAPAPAAVAAANDHLASHLDSNVFAQAAIRTGALLWSGALTGEGYTQRGAAAVRAGDALRRTLGHYQGGMFYFDGEWFWGIDRIRLLEQRLIEGGYREPGPLCVPEPTPAAASHAGANHVTLEYFPSLRSPYTAIGHARVLDLIARSGVTVKLRPVMPMLMRGVPAPFAKQQYIITDSGREARARKVPFGRFVDPFGEPVKRAFALFPAAVALNSGMQFVTAYLAAAWAEGVDITGEAGLQRVAAAAQINWSDLRDAARGSDWQAVLEDNLQAMLTAGLWGVPSFRVTGGRDDAPFACWGQDRIWRVETEIARRA